MIVPSWSTIPEHLRERILDDRNELCPAPQLVFRAFEEVPDIYDTKVVILGQDPYYVPGKANGLAFGYHEDYQGKIDSSLANIIEEVKRDTGYFSTVMDYQATIKRGEFQSFRVGEIYDDVSLQSWAHQGVLLINTRLTTTAGGPLGHANIGWEEVLMKFLEDLDYHVPDKVYMLWGKEAQSYAKYLDDQQNLILTTSHPCRHSAHKGFKGCGHFNQANRYLEAAGRKKIEW